MDRSEIYKLYEAEKAAADDIDPVENVELKQFHLGRASVYKDLLEGTIKL